MDYRIPELPKPGRYGHNNKNYAFCDVNELSRFQVCSTIQERDLIPLDKRGIDMPVFVSGVPLVYKGLDVSDVEWLKPENWENADNPDNLTFEKYGTVMGDPTGTEFHPVMNIDTTISLVNATRTFSITPTGASFNIWIKGKKYNYTTAQSVVIPDIEGLCIMYFNSLGVLVTSNTFEPSLIVDNAIVAIIYWNATDNLGKLFDERHGIKISGIDHLYKHLHIRAQYNNGLQISSITTNGTGDLDSDAQFIISDGTFDDEDLLNLVSETTLAGADKTIYYIGAGGVVRWFDNQSFPVRTFDGTSATRLCYNNPTTGALVQVASANYVLCHAVALNNGTTSFFIGQAEYTSIALARIGANEEALKLKTGLFDALTAEHILLFTLIFQTNLTYTNTVNARVQEVEAGISSYVDWRQTTITGNNGVNPTDHTLLTNLNSVNYTHLTDAQKTALTTGVNADGQHTHTLPISSITGTGFETAPAMGSTREAVFKSATGWFKLAWSTIITWLNTGQLLASSISNFQATVSVNTDVVTSKNFIDDALPLFVDQAEFDILTTADEGVFCEDNPNYLQIQTPSRKLQIPLNEYTPILDSKTLLIGTGEEYTSVSTANVWIAANTEVKYLQIVLLSGAILDEPLFAANRDRINVTLISIVGGTLELVASYAHTVNISNSGSTTNVKSSSEYVNFLTVSALTTASEAIGRNIGNFIISANQINPSTGKIYMDRVAKGFIFNANCSLWLTQSDVDVTGSAITLLNNEIDLMKGYSTISLNKYITTDSTIVNIAYGFNYIQEATILVTGKGNMFLPSVRKLTLPVITGSRDEVYFAVVPDGYIVDQVTFTPSANTAFTTLEVGFYLGGAYTTLCTFTYQANATRYISRLDTSVAANLTNTNIQIMTPYYNNGDNGNVLLACTGFTAMGGEVNITMKKI
jgi:hypothetical protein